MDDKRLQDVKQHLQDKDAQNRIVKNIARARSEATVTIGRAAELFRFTENQLRDWESRGLIFPNKSSGGQRLYPLAELDRLAVIRELLDTKKFSPGDIPDNVDVIWQAVARGKEESFLTRTGEVEGLTINQRVRQAESDNSWRYFIAQVMRLSLLLICEDMPDTIIGMILPLRKLGENEITKSAELPQAGTSLVGWLPRNRSFYAFLTAAPSFDFPSDFRVEQFRIPEVESAPLTPLIIVQRDAGPLLLSIRLVQAVQRLLTVLACHIDEWRSCLDTGMRDFVYQVTDFSAGQRIIDRALNDLMDRVVDLGGQSKGKNRWSFCGLLLPKDDTLPLQQRDLEVRAYSKDIPSRWNAIVLSKNYPGLSIRAYQSGHVIYRPDIPPTDFILPNRETEESTRSAIAIPIAGESGMAVAVLYVASDEVDAFSQADQRVLRLLTRMIEELLSTYQSRHAVVDRLANLLITPRIVDLAFREFLSEDDFINDLEEFLKAFQARVDSEPQSADQPVKSNDAVSFIVVDIDDQGSIAIKYGDRVARNLSREVGLRIRGQLGLLTNPAHRRLYHINADIYYMKLVGMPLEEARNIAQTLYTLLRGAYRIDARRVIKGRPMSREDMLEVPDVTVRVGVTSYQSDKLKSIFQRQTGTDPIVDLRNLILSNLYESLRRGQMEGGDAVFGWDPEQVAFVRWFPLTEQKK